MMEEVDKEGFQIVVCAYQPPPPPFVRKKPQMFQQTRAKMHQPSLLKCTKKNPNLCQRGFLVHFGFFWYISGFFFGTFWEGFFRTIWVFFGTFQGV